MDTNLYSVSELARVGGVSVRTLHHYHAIGLLLPAVVGENGYRYYGAVERRRLQQILFHRALGLTLEAIRPLLDLPDAKKVEVLREHMRLLESQAEEARQLRQRVARTIEQLEGGTMSKDEPYTELSAEKTAEYEAYLVEVLGPEVKPWLEVSKKTHDSRTPEERDAAAAELDNIETALVRAMEDQIAPDDPVLDVPLNRHRAWVAHMWGRECSPTAYGGLTDVYAHPDFVARYESLADGFSVYLTEAMLAYVARHSRGSLG